MKERKKNKKERDREWKSKNKRERYRRGSGQTTFQAGHSFTRARGQRSPAEKVRGHLLRARLIVLEMNHLVVKLKFCYVYKCYILIKYLLFGSCFYHSCNIIYILESNLSTIYFCLSEIFKTCIYIGLFTNKITF